MDNSENLKTQFGEILRSNGITDAISDVVIKNAADLKGAHMASVIEYATVSFIDSSKPDLELFIKKTIPSGGRTELEADFKMVTTKEGQILTKLVKELKSFSIDRLGSDELIRGLFPRVYYCDENSIIMDNLNKQNYKMLPKLDRQDMHTIKLVLKNLANFHAVGYSLIVNAGGKAKFEETHPYIVDSWKSPICRAMMTQIFDSNLKLVCDILEKASEDDTEAQKVLKLLKKHLGSSFSEILECFETDELFSVVGHGDFWNNNMMFCAGQEEVDEKVIFVDLQNCRVGSPNLDLAYYLLSTVKPELRKEWKEILEYYFQQLKDTVSSLGMDFPFQFEEFLEDLKRKSKLGFYYGLMVLIGYAAMDAQSKTDESHKEEDGEFVNNFNQMLSNWVEQNPEKRVVLCEDFKAIVNDYLQFGEL